MTKAMTQRCIKPPPARLPPSCHPPNTNKQERPSLYTLSIIHRTFAQEPAINSPNMCMKAHCSTCSKFKLCQGVQGATTNNVAQTRSPGGAAENTSPLSWTRFQRVSAALALLRWRGRERSTLPRLPRLIDCNQGDAQGDQGIGAKMQARTEDAQLEFGRIGQYVQNL